MISRTISTVTFAVLLGILTAGCVSHRITVPYVDWHYALPRYGMSPAIEASINGVPGRFLIDTGAVCPIISISAADRCRLAISPNAGYVGDAFGNRIPTMEATNVTLRLAAGFEIRLPHVIVSSAFDNPAEHEGLFGILDYETLCARQAVLDVKHKTITLNK